MVSLESADSREPSEEARPATSRAWSTSTDPVISAAVALLRTLGPTRVTVTDVAKRAGVSRMTVYRRFESRERLISAALTAEMAGLLSAAAQRSADFDTIRAQIVGQVRFVTTALGEGSLLAGVLDMEPESLLPLLVDRLGSGQMLIVEHLRRQLRQGQLPDGDGSVRPGDPSVMALLLLSAVQSFVVSRRALRTTADATTLTNELTDLVERYLRPDPEKAQ